MAGKQDDPQEIESFFDFADESSRRYNEKVEARRKAYAGDHAFVVDTADDDRFLEKISAAADAHVEATGDSEHATGDFEALFGVAWRLLTAGQRERFMADVRIRELAEVPEFEDLLGKKATDGDS